MGVPAELSVKLMEVAPYLASVSQRARDVLVGYCEQTGFAYSGRLKRLESIAEKVDTGRYQSWSQLDDLFGCSVIVPDLRQEPAVIEFVTRHFRVLQSRARGQALKDPTTFRFDSTRLVVALRTDVFGISADSALAKVRFEIQIRTAFEHAWCVSTHAGAYKGNSVDWRRIRLAAQVKAAVEQLDLMIAGYDHLADLISGHGWPEIECKVRIERALRSAVPADAAPDSWVRACDNVYGVIRAIASERRQRRDQVADAVIGSLEGELGRFNEKTYPRSLSTTQLLLGVLARDGLLPNSFKEFYPCVSGALTDLYPETRQVRGAFDFETGGP